MICNLLWPIFLYIFWLSTMYWHHQARNMVGIVLTVFAAVLAIRKCFCQLISTGKVFYRGQWSNFDQLATKENGSENRDKRKFPCAGVSLHRQFYNLRLKGYVCFSGSAFHFGFLPSKPSFSLKCVTLNSCYTEANRQWIGSFHAEQCDWSTKSKTGLFQLCSINQFDRPSSPRVH